VSPSPVDVYGSLFGGELPSARKAKGKGDMNQERAFWSKLAWRRSARKADYGDRRIDFGPDFLNISSSDPRIVNSTNSSTAIIWVAVTSSKNNTNYTLLVWGPSDYGKTAFNVTDLSIGSSKRV